ncbi:hypothetical protein K438DRAFT_2180527 [Mycena galopus ATCC 62051]|nr:hypothetical protein K438DRAFT_2180527 [Mycena galopus ATCC 62051]
MSTQRQRYWRLKSDRMEARRRETPRREADGDARGRGGRLDEDVDVGPKHHLALLPQPFYLVKATLAITWVRTPSATLTVSATYRVDRRVRLRRRELDEARPRPSASGACLIVSSCCTGVRRLCGLYISSSTSQTGSGINIQACVQLSTPAWRPCSARCTAARERGTRSLSALTNRPSAGHLRAIVSHPGGGGAAPLLMTLAWQQLATNTTVLADTARGKSAWGGWKFLRARAFMLQWKSSLVLIHLAPDSYAAQRGATRPRIYGPPAYAVNRNLIHPGPSRSTGANGASTSVAVLQYGSKYRKELASLAAAADSCERKYERTDNVAEEGRVGSSLLVLCPSACVRWPAVLIYHMVPPGHCECVERAGASLLRRRGGVAKREGDGRDDVDAPASLPSSRAQVIRKDEQYFVPRPIALPSSFFPNRVRLQVPSPSLGLAVPTDFCRTSVAPGDSYVQPSPSLHLSTRAAGAAATPWEPRPQWSVRPTAAGPLAHAASGSAGGLPQHRGPGREDWGWRGKEFKSLKIQCEEQAACIRDAWRFRIRTISLRNSALAAVNPVTISFTSREYWFEMDRNVHKADDPGPAVDSLLGNRFCSAEISESATGLRVVLTWSFARPDIETEEGADADTNAVLAPEPRPTPEPASPGPNRSMTKQRSPK